jgi:hypothetical protein
MPWIDPGWLDFKNERAQYRDNQRREAWVAASWWRKFLIWINGDSPHGPAHRRDWK